MSGSDKPLVSVLTPVYNGESFLQDCIESVLTQTYEKYEYIIVNNCSTDRTLEIALSYAAKDSRIRVHTNTQFVGVIENHNIAFDLISPTAKYCKVVSADDFIFPDCIRQMVGFAENNPSVGILGSYQLSGRYIKWQGFPYPRNVFSGAEVCRYFFFLDEVFVEGEPILGFGTPTSMLYRADLIRESRGHFYPNSSPHADTSACCKYLQGSNFGFIYQVLSYERRHGATQTSKSRQMNRYLSAALNDLIEYGPYYLNKEELEVQVSKALRAYHQFLAVSYFSGVRDKEFWDYHRNRLQELGYPLRRGTLPKAAFRKVLEELSSPEQAIKKVWSLVVRKRRDNGIATAQPGLLKSNDASTLR